MWPTELDYQVFITNFLFINISISTGATWWAGPAYTSGAPEIIPVFNWIRFAQSSVFFAAFCLLLLVFSSFNKKGPRRTINFSIIVLNRIYYMFLNLFAFQACFQWRFRFQWTLYMYKNWLHVIIKSGILLPQILDFYLCNWEFINQ